MWVYQNRLAYILGLGYEQRAKFMDGHAELVDYGHKILLPPF
jgi:hypothetical protein